MLSYIFNHWHIIYCGVKNVYMILPFGHLLNVINIWVFFGIMYPLHNQYS